MSFLHHQPWKFLYISFLATYVIFVKLPYWTVISIPRSQRPRPSWSVMKCVSFYITRSMMDIPLKLGIFFKRDLTLEVPDSELRNSKFAWVEGVDEESIQEPVRSYAKIAKVKPMRIPGYWRFEEGTPTTSVLQAKDDEKVLYHLHGGAFVVGSAFPSDAVGSIPLSITKKSATVSRSFIIDYRASASAPFPAENPFPSALLDCIAGYRYLTELGFWPENIIVSGDSAGGNLALALTRYLTKSAIAIPSLSPPGKLLLISSWGDPFSSPTSPTSSQVVNKSSDIFPVQDVTPGILSYGATAYLGSAFSREEAKSNEYISPSSSQLTRTDGMFKGFPRTYILAGDAEILLDHSKVIAERMKADNTSDGWVTLDVAEDAVHDFIVYPWAEPERSSTVVRISRWIDQN